LGLGSLPRLDWRGDRRLPFAAPRLLAPNLPRSSHIRTFVARSQPGFSHDESEGGTLSGLVGPRASAGYPIHGKTRGLVCLDGR
jgi:hypothetical protein